MSVLTRNTIKGVGCLTAAPRPSAHMRFYRFQFRSFVFLRMDRTWVKSCQKRLFDPLEQLGWGHIESWGESFQRAQANLFSAGFQIRNVVFVNANFFGKVNLTPTALNSQFLDSLSECDTNVPCYSYHRGDTLRRASTLSRGRISKTRHNPVCIC